MCRGQSQLAAFHYDVIASSDLVRAVETAAAVAGTSLCLASRRTSHLRQRVAVAAYHPATYYGTVDPDLREMGFGELEGQRIAAAKESGAMAAIQDQWAAGDWSVRWPGIGGESPEQVVTRGMRGLLVRVLLATPLS